MPPVLTLGVLLYKANGRATGLSPSTAKAKIATNHFLILYRWEHMGLMRDL